jgi:thiamine biosynthesis lipoprotein
MNRRDFLHPRRLAHTAGQVLGALDLVETSPALPLPQEVALLRLARRAMATHFEIVLPFGAPNAVPMAEVAFDLLDELEEQLTVYRDTSEVSELNRRAPDGPVAVEERLFGLLELSARLAEATEGAFDVTAGALIKAWGFFRGPRRVPSEAERHEALARVGMRHVVLAPTARAVRYLRPGLEINLGSIGKGYALDRLAELLGQDGGLPAFLLHGGSSSVYAKGSITPNGRGWPVGIAHPWVRGRRLGVVWLRDRALGTSAATFQHLVYNGRKLGHILDPRSGWPAEGLASATVLAPTAAEADALATAFYILGVDKARAYCEARPEVGAVLLRRGSAAPPVLLGLGPDVVDLASPGNGRASSDVSAS